MAAGWTNRGKKLRDDVFLRGAAAPATFYAALVTAAAAPGPDTNVLSDLTQITAGNGYASGGVAIERSAVGWPTLTEDDANDLAEAIAKDVGWTPAGGPIPAAGGNMAYLVITTDEAVVADRQVVMYFGIGSLSFADGVAFTVSGLTSRTTEPA